MRFAFIGNFQAPFSTENDRAWSLNKLGHEVSAFQENQTTVDEVLSHQFDYLIYSHTHGWEMKGIEHLITTTDSISVHLDLWSNLARQSDVGKEATWLCKWVFTPDMSIKLSNHYFMRPGVKESSCYLAAPDPVRFPYDVAFVGSYGYHPEYPQRPALIDFLKKEYGDRFLLIDGGMRGHDLNVLYRSVPIIVGDSCFSQSNPIPGYYSDRVPETTGRGGLLLHPRVDSIKNSGVVMWNDYTDLKTKIEYFLSHPLEAETMRLKGFHHTNELDNYTQIMQEVIDEVCKN